jgi:hypothetical protein
MPVRLIQENADHRFTHPPLLPNLLKVSEILDVYLPMLIEVIDWPLL